MSINTRHALHPLALAVTLALAARGGAARASAPRGTASCPTVGTTARL